MVELQPAPTRSSRAGLDRKERKTLYQAIRGDGEKPPVYAVRRAEELVQSVQDKLTRANWHPNDVAVVVTNLDCFIDYREVGGSSLGVSNRALEVRVCRGFEDTCKEIFPNGLMTKQ